MTYFRWQLHELLEGMADPLSPLLPFPILTTDTKRQLTSFSRFPARRSYAQVSILTKILYISGCLMC